VDVGYPIVSVVPVAYVLLNVGARGGIQQPVIFQDRLAVPVRWHGRHGCKHVNGVGVAVLRDFGNRLVARYVGELWRLIVARIKVELLFEIAFGVVGR
jgi:hypothetical protein